VLGSLLITETTSKVEKSLGGFGVPKATADRIAHAVSGASGGASSGGATASRASRSIVHAVQVDFAQATKIVVIGMAAAMAAAFVVALLGLPAGRVEQEQMSAAEPRAGTGQAAAPVA
jgi:hypothetical protein